MAALLAKVRGGDGQALAICGGAGIGKTVLLEHAVSAASDFETVKATGVESEVTLGYAGLHQLLAPLLGGAEFLPPPQRSALERAFGSTDGPPPDRLLVGLASLAILGLAAVQRPLLCAIDDAHWLDRDSLEVLGFVARRLAVAPVAMIFSLREEDPWRGALEGVRRFEIGELRPPAVDQLLDLVGGGPLDPDVRARLRRAAAGNPLALIEFARGLTAAERDGRRPFPEPLLAGVDLQRRFARRAGELSGPAATVALLAAAEPSCEPATLWRAARELGVDAAEVGTVDLEPLLDLGPPLEFRHPMVRAAVYSSASIARRHRAHAALASAFDPALDGDRRAWHLAAATDGPSEVVARQLELGSRRAHRRGGYAASAEFLERAAGLSPDPARRVERLLGAGEASLLAGASARSEELLEAARASATDPLGRGLVLRLEGRLRFALGRPYEAPSRLLSAAMTLQPVAPELARDTFLEALQATFFAGRTKGVDGRLEIAAAARRARLGKAAQTSVPDLLLDGFVGRLSGDLEVGVPLLQRALTELRAEPIESGEDLRWLLLGCAAAGDLLDDDSLTVLARRWVEVARTEGALSVLPLALIFLARAELSNGRFDRATAAVAEEREIIALTGNPGVVGQASYGELFVKAWRGEEEATRAAAAATVDDSLSRGQGAGLMFAHLALAMLELGLGRFPEALARARSLYDDDALYMGTHALPIMVEAAAMVGDHRSAQLALERFEPRASSAGGPLALGLLARCRALVGEPEEAERQFEMALGLVGESRARLELARTHLVYGEWLRGRGRTGEAEQQLTRARGLCGEIGATAFERRAAAGLSDPSPGPPSDAIDLSRREVEVLRLLATNLTLPEIAAELYVSANTARTHAKSIYRKLDVHKRSEAVARARVLGLIG